MGDQLDITHSKVSEARRGVPLLWLEIEMRTTRRSDLTINLPPVETEGPADDSAGPFVWFDSIY
jgi:hypothetical protein